MPTFDVVSQVDMQEVKNAVDQASREVTTRFDFKNTDSGIELSGNEVLPALGDRRPPPGPGPGGRGEAGQPQGVPEGARPRQGRGGGQGNGAPDVTLKAGITSDDARGINRFIKDNAAKGVSSQTQGDQIRVTGKKRDDLQAVIAALREQDFGFPLQFENFRATDAQPGRAGPAARGC